MGELRCVDGSVLSVEAVSCRDRVGRPYEITLNLTRNSVPFAAVGQRCGYELARLAEQVSAARGDPALAAAWPDPDDRFPPAPGAGAPAGVAGDSPAAPPAAGYVAADHEYFTLRARDRVDPPGAGELRCVVRSSAEWLGERIGIGTRTPPRQRPGRPAPGRPPLGGHGGWRLTRRAVIEAWGAGGVGVRAVLTSSELMAFLDTVLRGKSGGADVPLARRPRPPQRRVLDGSPQSGLPAVRAPARARPVAAGRTPARRGDVRRKPAVGEVRRAD